ncbi:MAG: hypothetical protein ABI434_07785 [Burkholderiaceae bacterium]
MEEGKESMNERPNLHLVGGSSYIAEGGLTGSGNEPPYDGGMEARVAKLEAGLEHVQKDIAELKADVRSIRDAITGIRTTDFRIMFGAIITVALGLSALMAKGFHWL